VLSRMGARDGPAAGEGCSNSFAYHTQATPRRVKWTPYNKPGHAQRDPGAGRRHVSRCFRSTTTTTRHVIVFKPATATNNREARSVVQDRHEGSDDSCKSDREHSGSITGTRSILAGAGRSRNIIRIQGFGREYLAQIRYQATCNCEAHAPRCRLPRLNGLNGVAQRPRAFRSTWSDRPRRMPADAERVQCLFEPPTRRSVVEAKGQSVARVRSILTRRPPAVAVALLLRVTATDSWQLQMTPLWNGELGPRGGKRGRTPGRRPPMPCDSNGASPLTCGCEKRR